MTEETAEIIVVGTSLGSVRRQFFATRRARHFLDCKHVPYYVIDANRDISDAKKLLDEKLFAEWREKDYLMSDPVLTENPLLPQVIINGVPVGDDTALQDLEEDGDFDWIVSKNACPSCLHATSPNHIRCNTCAVEFKSLIPEDAWSRLKVIKYLSGNTVRPDTTEEATKSKQHEFTRAMSVKLGRVNADLTFDEEE